jgi:hypothetical protein
MLTEMQLFREKGRKLPVFANSCWKMLLKAIGQLLVTAKRV